MDEAKKKVMFVFLTTSLGLSERAAALAIVMADNEQSIYRTTADWVLKCNGRVDNGNIQCFNSGCHWSDACYWCQHFMMECDIEAVLEGFRT